MKRSTLALAACASLVLALVGYQLFFPKPGLPSAPLRALPADIDAFARVRVARVLASAPWREIVVERKEDRGIQEVRRVCGFNPLESLEEVWVFARPAAAKLEWAVSARGAPSQAKLIDCLTKFSGGTLQDYVHERVAGFDTMRNKRGTERAAFVGRDGFVAGGAEAVKAALSAISGKRASADSDLALKQLYEALSTDSELSLVARLPDEPRRRTRLLERLGMAEHMLPAGLEALTLELHLIEERIRFVLRLSFAQPQRARALSQQVEELRAQILALPGLSLVGVGPTLRALAIEQEQSAVRVRGEIRAATVNTLIDRLPALAALQGLAPAKQAVPRADAGAPQDGGAVR